METSVWKLTTHEEEVLHPLVVKILSHRPKDKVFSNKKIRAILEEFGEEIADSQIRKIVFNIRHSGVIPLLIANSEGYYMASNIEEVNAWIDTHRGKIQAMQMTLNNIEFQFEQFKEKLKSGDDCGLIGQMSIFDLL
jgi:dephospho-CoA kinase